MTKRLLQMLTVVVGFIVFGLCIGLFGIVVVIVAVVCGCSVLWYVVGGLIGKSGMCLRLIGL